MCLFNCRTLGRVIYGRASSMLIYKDLNKRQDRVAVPLPFGDRGGLLLSPRRAQLDCLYGIDGATYLLNDKEKPGCSRWYCEPQNPWANHQLCGFSGAPANSWHAADLKQVLTLHAEHGAQYHAPGWHSGYNELVINSKHHNDDLPDSVEAFFQIKGQSVRTDLGYGFVINVNDAHQAFLAEYDLDATQVPLLEFDPFNWETPFTDVSQRLTEAWSGFR